MDGRLDWTATSRDSPERSSLLGSLAALSCEALAPLLERTFGACETVFLELANNASSTYDEQRLLEFRRALSAKKSAVMADFAARITTEFTRLRQPELGDPPGDAAALELVAQEQIEKQLLVSGGVARVRSEWRTALEQLHERMLAIAPRDFRAQDNPLDPGRIAQTFLGACEQLQADIKCLQLLCRQFDVHVLGHLDGFYRSSNQVLIDARVLPEFALVRARQRQRTPLTERSPELSAAPSRADSFPAVRAPGMPAADAAGTRHAGIRWTRRGERECGRGVQRTLGIAAPRAGRRDAVAVRGGRADAGRAGLGAADRPSAGRDDFRRAGRVRMAGRG
jgi:hypothetical protein